MHLCCLFERKMDVEYVYSFSSSWKTKDDQKLGLKINKRKFLSAFLSLLFGPGVLVQFEGMQKQAKHFVPLSTHSSQ